ncbi:hypothetical protein HanRHA438_Chr14g0655731 [Helianthus annuus]|nr:hypothetical protein HanRHA438_Chr14g0655731 [Helianthus annuus]
MVIVCTGEHGHRLCSCLIRSMFDMQWGTNQCWFDMFTGSHCNFLLCSQFDMFGINQCWFD